MYQPVNRKLKATELILLETCLPTRVWLLLRKRTDCRTLEDALRYRHRESLPGWGEKAERALQEAASLNWLSAPDHELLIELESLLRQGKPESVCRRLLERPAKKPEDYANELLAGVALRAFECLPLASIYKCAYESAFLGDAFTPQAESPLPRVRLGCESPELVPVPCDGLTAYYLTTAKPLHHMKEEFLQSLSEKSWYEHEHLTFELCRTLVPMRLWSPLAFGKLAPSWVVRRRLVRSVVSLELARRAERYSWHDFEVAFGRLWKKGSPDLSLLCEEAVALAAVPTPVWPSATGTISSLPRTFEEAFFDWLERLPQRVARLLRLRLGIDVDHYGKALSLVETGGVLGLSAERVRQIQRSTLDHLITHEAWPFRLADRLRGEPIGACGIDWLPERVEASRPFFPLLVGTLLGRDFCKHLGLPGRALTQSPLLKALRI